MAVTEMQSGTTSDMPSSRVLSLAFVLLLLNSCVSYIPTATSYSELNQSENQFEEAQLLDVGIVIFDTGLDQIDDDDLAMSLPQIRSAESRYMPVLLKQTLIHTQNWGEVLVVGTDDYVSDIQVRGRIIESTGYTLHLNITVHDSSNKQWFDKDYIEHIGENIYGQNSLGVNDPFQSLYNRIANDLLNYRQTNITQAELDGIRSLSELQFANRFSPEAFADFVETSKDGVDHLARLPAFDDPLLVHLQAIRQRDRMFHNLLQQRYDAFSRRIGENYYDWRRINYQEVKELQDKKNAARRKLVNGAFWLGASVALGDVDGFWGNTAVALTALHGTRSISDGLAGLETSWAFIEESAASFGDDVSTQVVIFDEDEIILTGTAEELYGQWKDVLQQLYDTEVVSE